MKAYIINLKEAIERRNYMQKQLALLPPSLSSEFIEAVNGCLSVIPFPEVTILLVPAAPSFLMQAHLLAI